MLQLTSNEAAQALKMQRPDQPINIQLGYKGHTFDVILAPGQPSVAPVDFTPWLFENEDAAFYTHGEWWEHHVEVRLLAPNAQGSQSLIPVSKACTGMVPSLINLTFDVIVLCEDLIAELARAGSGTSGMP